MNTEDRDLVTAAWIARRVGVGRAAVANWRKRHPDFPAPVEDAPGTLFSWNAVRTWLIETGKAEQLASVGRTGTGTQQIGDAAPPIETPDRDLASLSPQELLGRVLVALLPRLGEEDPPEDDSQPPAVLDPACEDPSVLLALAERFGDHVTAVGQAPTTAHARIVREALPEPLLDLRIGDGLATDQFPALHGQARGVVCIPPRESRQWPAHDLAADPRWRYGLPEPGEAELAWVQHCVAYLRHHGVAVVVVSPITGVRSTGRHIRTALVREGVLRDVIALPEKLTPSGEGKVHVWVLQRQAVAKPVRMIDLTWLADIADVPTTRAEWDLLTAAEDPSVTRSVPHRELLDGEVALTPSWYLRPRPAEAVDLGEFTHRLEQLYARVGHALRQPLASPLQSHHAKVTLGELERSRALTILPRDAPHAEATSSSALWEDLPSLPPAMQGTRKASPKSSALTKVGWTRTSLPCSSVPTHRLCPWPTLSAR